MDHSSKMPEGIAYTAGCIKPSLEFFSNPFSGYAVFRTMNLQEGKEIYFMKSDRNI